MTIQVDMIRSNGGQACIIDTSGRVLLEPRVEVDSLYYPTYGMSLVERGGRFGYIDTDGDLLIDFKYKKAYPFSENGLAFVMEDYGQGGYIDRNGHYVIPPEFETGSNFQFGLAAISRGGIYEFIYESGCQAINGKFKYAGGFSKCGLAKYENLRGNQGFLDTRSRVVVEFKKDCQVFEFKGDTRVTKFRAKNRDSMIDASGKIITGFYDRLIIGEDSLLHPFLRNGLWGYVNSLGEEVISNVYKEAGNFSEDKLARVKAFDPLAENQVKEFFINEQDQIVDFGDLDHKYRHLKEDFISFNSFKRSIALAVKKL